MAPALSLLAYRFVAERTARREIGPATAAGYRKALLRTLRVMGAETPDQLTRRRIERWVEHSNLATSTLRNHVSQLKVFSRWLLQRGLIHKDPTLGIARLRQPRLLPRALTCEEVARLIATVPTSRARLVVTLIAQEGLRIGEVSRLEVGDLDWLAQVMTVRGKGGHERVLPIMDETQRAIGEYLLDYPATAGPLIRSLRDGRSAVSAETLSRYMRRWLLRAGIKHGPNDGKSAHAIRHTFAQELADRGATPFQLRDALGHANVATVQIYIRRNVPGLREAMEGRWYGDMPPDAA